MRRTTKKIFSSISTMFLSCTFLAGTVALAPNAYAECKGENSRENITEPTLNDFVYETYEVKIDSCKSQELIDSYGNVKDAAGLAGLLGAAFPPAGIIGGVFYGWAWNNQDKVKECASSNTGITFTESNGIISGCSPQ